MSNIHHLRKVTVYIASPEPCIAIAGDGVNTVSGERCVAGAGIYTCLSSIAVAPAKAPAKIVSRAPQISIIP